MDTAHDTTPSPSTEPSAAAAQAASELSGKLVVIAFLLAISLLGFISLVDLLANLFRD